MGGFKATAFENCSYASNLGYSVSPREETGVLDEIGKTERDRYKTDKNFWMNQVNDKWDTFMFQQAYNWKVHDLPEEVKKKLSSGFKDGADGCVSSWFSLSNLGDVSKF